MEVWACVLARSPRVLLAIDRGGLNLGRRLPLAGKGLSRDMYSVAFLIVAWRKKLASLNPMCSRGTITHAMK